MKMRSKQSKLVITGVTHHENRLLVISVPKVFYDALRMYGIVKGIKGGAKNSALSILKNDKEMQKVLDYFKQFVTIEERNKLLKNMEESE